MKSFSKFFVVVLVGLSASAGPFINFAMAQGGSEDPLADQGVKARLEARRAAEDAARRNQANDQRASDYESRASLAQMVRKNGDAAPWSAKEYWNGKTTNELFNFPGGTPLEFLTAAQKQFNADWLSVATIPVEMENVHVPRLRFPTNEQPQDILNLYNRLGEANPALGKWHWEGPATMPAVLMLVPGSRPLSLTYANSPESSSEVKVFQLKFVAGSNLTTLANAVTLADESAQQTARKDGHKPVPGRVVIDERTGCLIVSGSPESLKIAAQLIATLDAPSLNPPVEAPRRRSELTPGQTTPDR